MNSTRRYHSRCSTTLRAVLFLGSLLALFVVAGAPALAQISYSLTAGTGTATNMTGASELIGADADDDASSIEEIGFSFQFAGTSYTDFSVNSNGLLRLGTSTVTTSFDNENIPCAHVIAAFWDDMHTRDDGGVYTTLTGSSPNQVRTIEWRVAAFGDESDQYHTTFQVRLYEGTDRIEFWYGSTDEAASFDGTMGVAACSTDFLSIAGGASPALHRRILTEDNDFPASGTLYTLTPIPYVAPPIWITSPEMFADICLADVLAEGISIGWDAEGPTNVKIDISGDNGTTWQTIVSSVSASASPYTWSIPTNQKAGFYHLRVSEVGNPSVNDAIEILIDRPIMTHIDAFPRHLWPADNQMHLIDIETFALGGCEPNVNLHSVTANGGPAGDIQIIDDSQVMLRATCAGAIDARVYTIVYRTVDGALEQFDTVRVPVICSSRWLTGLNNDDKSPVWLGEPGPNPVPRDFFAFIPFDMPDSCTAVLDVYNLRGKWQKTIYINPDSLDSEEPFIDWDGAGVLGTRLPGGTYILQLTACGIKKIQAITLSDMNMRGTFPEGEEPGGGEGEPE